MSLDQEVFSVSTVTVMKLHKKLPVKTVRLGIFSMARRVKHVLKVGLLPNLGPSLVVYVVLVVFLQTIIKSAPSVKKVHRRLPHRVKIARRENMVLMASATAAKGGPTKTNSGNRLVSIALLER